jgi:Protein of unknown function (DUF4038)
MRALGKRAGSLVLLVWTAALGSPSAEAQNSQAQRWRPWEQELISTTDYTAGGGNPYRDLALTVQYWRRPAGATSCGAPVSGGDSFTSFGFWEGGKRMGTPPVWSPNPKRFVIRSMFPDGTGAWCWKTTCSRSLPDASPSSTLDCTGDTGLAKSGQVTLTNVTSSNRLYTLGLPKPATDKRSLVYADNATPFPWLGDTAWDAPIHYGDGRWAGYVTDRTSTAKDFRTVLVAPATQTSASAPAVGFKYARGDCSATDKAVVPNRCSTWDGDYWERFDELVLTANSTGKGLLVVVAGVMDPTVRGGANNGLGLKFPAVPEAKVFARNLAARLAGYFVMFSPSYDTQTDPAPAANHSVDGKTVTELIKAVGPAIKSAAPRHLVGTHLAGSNSLAAYLDFQTDAWLGFQVFQSGHGGSNAGAPCNFQSATINDFKRAVCRAREGALEFRCIREASPPNQTPVILPACTNGNSADRVGTPKPAVNVEGEYESAYVRQADGTLVRSLAELVPSRARSRHTAWATALSGSFGFNIGYYIDITAWANPAAYSDSYREGGITNPFQSDNDLGQMTKILGQAPWSIYEPWHTLVDNAGLTEENKRHLAVAGPIVIVHVPGVSPDPAKQPTVKLFKVANTPLANLACSTSHATWVDPRSVGRQKDVGAKCDSIPGGIQLSVKPLPSLQLTCSDQRAPCDWILMLQVTRTLASANAPNAVESSVVRSLNPGKAFVLDNDLQVWTEQDEDSLGVSVWAQLLSLEGEELGDPFVVHPPNPRMRALPTTTRDGNGNFLVVWEQEGDDATDDVVAVQVSNDGIVLGEPAAVNSSTENQNGEPAVTSDSEGNSVVTWTEYPLDGSLGDIQMQIFSASGIPIGGPLPITRDEGNQYASQVQADASGEVVVAWTSDPSPPANESLESRKAKPAASQGVYFRRISSDGKPRGPEHAVHGNGKGRDRLVELRVKPNGEFKIVWETVNKQGGIEGRFQQDFDKQGNPKSRPKRRGSS